MNAPPALHQLAGGNIDLGNIKEDAIGRRMFRVDMPKKPKPSRLPIPMRMSGPPRLPAKKPVMPMLPGNAQPGATPARQATQPAY
jgi:hypothetical protein